jgi:hypothetical protein
MIAEAEIPFVVVACVGFFVEISFVEMTQRVPPAKSMQE